MRMILRGLSGPAADLSVELIEGQPLAVGRLEHAKLEISQDATLSGLHFSLIAKDGTVLLTDLGSRNGTFVNGNTGSGTITKPWRFHRSGRLRLPPGAGH